MQSGLASPLMFVREIQGAHTLSVLEVNTSWNPYRRADILIPDTAKTQRRKLTFHHFFVNSVRVF